MIKRVLCMALAITIMLSAFTVLAAKFSDLDEAHWAYENVELLAELGIIDGYPDGTFKPAGEVTRYEYAKLLCEAMKIAQITPDTAVFDDVKKSHWAYGYANAVEPYMTYYKGGATKEYRGDVAAEREDIAASLVCVLGWTNEPVSEDTYTKFSDYADITEDLRKYVLIAYEKGLVTGYPDGTFGPSRSVTRAETAALLIRAMGDSAVKPNDPKTPIPNGPPNPILEEFIDENQFYFDAFSGEVYSVEARVAGDAVIVTRTFLMDIVDEELTRSLWAAELDEAEETHRGALAALVSKGVGNAEYIVIYADKNGKEICSRVYKQ